MFRTTFEKVKPIDIRYRTFKKFDNNKVANHLQDTMSNINHFDQFELSLLNILNTHAPIKTKKLRSNTKRPNKAGYHLGQNKSPNESVQ